MTLQSLIVAVIVAACTVSVVWTLMPARLRRTCAAAALHLRLPAKLAAHLQRAAVARSAGGCGSCEGCASATSRPGAPALQTALQPGSAPIRFHPRLRR